MWTIGLHLHIGMEQSRRVVEGILQYAAENPDVAIRDFSFPRNEIALPESPPWIGKADAVIAGLSRVPDIVPWLRRGGVPVINTSADLYREVASVFTDRKSLALLAVEHFQ